MHYELIKLRFLYAQNPSLTPASVVRSPHAIATHNLRSCLVASAFAGPFLREHTRTHASSRSYAVACYISSLRKQFVNRFPPPLYSMD